MINCFWGSLWLIPPWIPSPKNVVCREISLVIIGIILTNSQWPPSAYSTLGTLYMCSYLTLTCPLIRWTLLLSSLYKWKNSLRETTWPTQGYIANNWLSQDLTLSMPDFGNHIPTSLFVKLIQPGLATSLGKVDIYLGDMIWGLLKYSAKSTISISLYVRL